MFVMQKTYDSLLDNSRRVFLEHMADNVRIERKLDEAYRFAHKCCDEIFKHTGKHDFHERLDKIIRD